jgi:hypothetical protein
MRLSVRDGNYYAGADLAVSVDVPVSWEESKFTLSLRTSSGTVLVSRTGSHSWSERQTIFRLSTEVSGSVSDVYLWLRIESFGSTGDNDESSFRIVNGTSVEVYPVTRKIPVTKY